MPFQCFRQGTIEILLGLLDLLLGQQFFQGTVGELVEEHGVLVGRTALPDDEWAQPCHELGQRLALEQVAMELLAPAPGEGRASLLGGEGGAEVFRLGHGRNVEVAHGGIVGAVAEKLALRAEPGDPRVEISVVRAGKDHHGLVEVILLEAPLGTGEAEFLARHEVEELLALFRGLVGIDDVDVARLGGREHEKLALAHLAKAHDKDRDGLQMQENGIGRCKHVFPGVEVPDGRGELTYRNEREVLPVIFGKSPRVSLAGDRYARQPKGRPKRPQDFSSRAAATALSGQEEGRTTMPHWRLFCKVFKILASSGRDGRQFGSRLVQRAFAC